MTSKNDYLMTELNRITPEAKNALGKYATIFSNVTTDAPKIVTTTQSVIDSLPSSNELTTKIKCLIQSSPLDKNNLMNLINDLHTYDKICDNEIHNAQSKKKELSLLENMINVAIRPDDVFVSFKAKKFGKPTDKNIVCNITLLDTSHDVYNVEILLSSIPSDQMSIFTDVVREFSLETINNLGQREVYILTFQLDNITTNGIILCRNVSKIVK
jgi:hypothetical protein